MKKAKYEIGDKVIFNSQVFIVHDVRCSSDLTYWYFIKGYNKGNNARKIIRNEFLKPYNE